MPYNPRPSGGGGSSISNAGGTVSIDGAGAVHVTPADGQNTNIGGGALAISAPLEDANTAVFKAVDGHSFYVGPLGSESLLATIAPASGLSSFASLYDGTLIWPGTKVFLQSDAGTLSFVDASSILNSIGTTRGSLLYRGVSGWAAVTPGTSTYVLTSNGIGADPSWQAAGGFDPASPGAIGGTTPSTGAFTSITIGGVPLSSSSGAWITADRFYASAELITNQVTGNFSAPVALPTGLTTYSIEVHNGSSPGTPTGGARMYAASGEMRMIDASGNDSIVSPHAKDGPPEMYETGPGVDEMLRRANIYLGVVNWWATTRRQVIDALDMRARLGTPEDSAAAWAEVLDRRNTGRIACSAVETVEAYEQRTGSSLYPGSTLEERAAWAAMTPLQRWDSVQQRDVVASVQRHADWTTRRDQAAAVHQPFSEPESLIYQAAPAPAWIPRSS